MADEETTDEETQEVPGGFTGTEKLVGATALLKEVKALVEGIMYNPAISAGAFRSLGDRWYQYIIKNLRETKKLSKENREEIDAFVKKAANINTITGFFVGLALRVSQTTIELRKASTEMGRFTNLSSLPGGATTAFGGMANLQLSQFQKAFQFNKDFADDWRRNYEEVNMWMKKTANEGQKQNLIEVLTGYGRNYGAGTGGMFNQLMNTFGSQGLTPQGAVSMIQTMYDKIETGKFGQGTKEDITKAFLQTMMGLGEAGVIDPNRAYGYTQQMFSELGGTFGGVELGKFGSLMGKAAGNISTWEAISALGYGNPNQGEAMLRKYGPAGIPVALQQAMVNLLGPNRQGTIRDITQLGRGERGAIEKYAAMEGIGTDMLLKLYNHPELTRNLEQLANIIKDLDVTADKAAKGGLREANAEMAARYRNTIHLWEYVTTAFGGATTIAAKAQSALGIPPWALELAATGAAIYFAGGGAKKFARYGMGLWGQVLGGEVGGVVAANAVARQGYAGYGFGMVGAGAGVTNVPGKWGRRALTGGRVIGGMLLMNDLARMQQEGLGWGGGVKAAADVAMMFGGPWGLVAGAAARGGIFAGETATGEDIDALIARRAASQPYLPPPETLYENGKVVPNAAYRLWMEKNKGGAEWWNKPGAGGGIAAGGAGTLNIVVSAGDTGKQLAASAMNLGEQRRIYVDISEVLGANVG